MLSVNRVDYSRNLENFYSVRNKNTQPIFKANETVIDKSNNNKFDVSEAAKNFGKGVISPIKAAIEHPFVTAGILAGTVAACSLVPVLGPILAVGFGAYSVGQLGKGCYDVAKNCAKGDYDKAEKSFDTVGQGFIGSLLSLVGVKQGAKVAREAKYMSELNTNVISAEVKSDIALQIKNNGFYNNLKEILSLFTTKSGIKATVRQFSPSAIKARAIEAMDFLRGKKVEKEVEIKQRKNVMTSEEFKKTPEGIRRASLSDEQIEAEMKALYNKVFDELGVPKEQRPNFEIRSAAQNHGGSYTTNGHTLEVNPNSYRSGTFELEDIFMHEATHCREALMRAGIPKEQVNQIVKEQLLSRIINGESEKIILKGGFMGNEMMTPPEMSAGMKSDFAQFAKENLYTSDRPYYRGLSKYSSEGYWLTANDKTRVFKPEALSEAAKEMGEFYTKLKNLLVKHPEFVEQYGSEQEAMINLANYSLSHTNRYNFFIDTAIKNSKTGEILKVEELAGEELAHAKQSLINQIETAEGNSRIGGIGGLFATDRSFNQYQFSPEEVLAQRNGNSYLIRTLTQKLDALKQAGKLSAEDEAFMNMLINKAKAIIEYKNKGLEFYQKYTEMINNPEDKELAQIVKVMEEELQVLKNKISEASTFEFIEKVKTMVRITGVSKMFPRNEMYQLLGLLKDGEKIG